MGNSPITECKQGEIAREFEILNAKKGLLHERIGTLCDKLQNVLRKSEEMDKERQPVKHAPQSQLATALSGVNDSLEADIGTVDDIINRLEL